MSDRGVFRRCVDTRITLDAQLPTGLKSLFMVSPSSAENPSTPWRAAGAAVAAMIRLVPRRYRFGFAVRLSRAVVLVVRHTPHFRQLVNAKLDTPEEIALHLLMHVMTTNDVAFDPDITIDGYDRFLDAVRSGRGVLLAAPHASLTLTAMRSFHDDGLRTVFLAPDPRMRITGTTAVAETLQRSPTLLVQVRTKLREGWLVATMLDRADREPGTIVFDTTLGPVVFMPALLHVAARCGAHVVFSEIHLEGSRLRGRIVPASSGTGEGYEREFVEFVRSAINRRAALLPGGRLRSEDTSARRNGSVVPVADPESRS